MGESRMCALKRVGLLTTRRHQSQRSRVRFPHRHRKNRKLYRITDLDAWREGNRAESFLFPNYAEDSATPAINRVTASRPWGLGSLPQGSGREVQRHGQRCPAV